MATRYYIRIPDTEQARSSGDFAFHSQGAEGLAAELQDALRSDALFQRWRAAQEDPDAIDDSMGEVDPAAVVEGDQHDLHINLVATTDLPGGIFKHRLRLLAGSAWQLRDVKAA